MAERRGKHRHHEYDDRRRDDRRRDDRRRRRRSEEVSPVRKRENERSRSPNKRSTGRERRDDRRRDDPRERERRNDIDDHSKRDRNFERREIRIKEEPRVNRPPSQTKDDRSPHRPWIDVKDKAESEPAVVVKKAEPNFSVSGKLAAETNTLNGVLIKYSEPPEARKPKTKWRFYEFKGDDLQNTLYIHRQSAYLIGRDRKVVDFPTDHPSCSKQQAVLQYRLTDYVKDDGRKGKKVRPYIIDLESTNGTYVNNNRIDDRRYVELKEKDVVKFGFSSREYVILHENSKDSEDDDVGDINPD